MSTFTDDIFSTTVRNDSSSTTLANTSRSNIAPEGFTSRDYSEWWKPMLNVHNYNIAFTMIIPINSYIYDPDNFYPKIIDKFITVCNNTSRYRHSEISVTFRYREKYHNLYEHGKPTGSYLNWFKKRPLHIDEVEFIQFCVAFRRNEITYMQFLNFALATFSTVYKSSVSDVRFFILREDKLKNAVNKIWYKHNFQDLAEKMLDIKTKDCWNRTSTYETHREFKQRILTQSYYKAEQREYEEKGLYDWFEKYGRRYDHR